VICSACHRRLNAATVTIGRLVLGPVCKTGRFDHDKAQDAGNGADCVARRATEFI